MWYLHRILKYCTIIFYACAPPKPLFSRLSVFLKSFYSLRSKYLYEIKRDTDIKTRHRCIAIWRWRNQRVNFSSLRKKVVRRTLKIPSRGFPIPYQATKTYKGNGVKLNTHKIAPYHSRSKRRSGAMYLYTRAKLAKWRAWQKCDSASNHNLEIDT